MTKKFGQGFTDGEANKLSIPLSSMEVFKQLPIKFPSFDDVQAIAPGEGTYPSGMEIEGGQLFLMMGSGSWVVVYDIETWEELTVFRVATPSVGRAVEGLVVHTDGPNRYLTTINDSRFPVRYDISTLPVRLSEPTPTNTYTYQCRGQITSDTQYIYITKDFRGFGETTNDGVGVFNKSDLTLVREINIDPAIAGGPGGDSLNKKVQSFTAHRGNFYFLCGSLVSDTRPIAYNTDPAIVKTDYRGNAIDSISFDSHTVRDAIIAEGYDSTLFEFEGSCSYEDDVYATVVINETTNNGVWIVKLESSGIDFRGYTTSAGQSASHRMRYGCECDYNGIKDPSTGLPFTSLQEISQWMHYTGNTRFAFYSTGSTINDFNGTPIPSGRMVELITGNFDTMKLTITGGSFQDLLWVTGSATSGTQVQTLIAQIP